MPARLDDWVDRLKNRPLPVMAPTVQGVKRLLGRASTTNAGYQPIVARDPGFALSIFRHLGSLPRPPREPVTGLAHAVALAGTAPLEAGVTSLPVIRNGADDAGRRGLLACYSRAAHAAMFISAWAETRKDPNPEELMLAALLHDCGEMALWADTPERMAASENPAGECPNRETAWIGEFGFTPALLSLGLARAWALPRLMRESLTPAGAFQPRPLGVMLACELARSSASSWDSAETMELIELAAEYCRQTTHRAAAAIHSRSAETARRLQGLPLPPSAWPLLQLRPAPQASARRTPRPAPARAESPACPTPSPPSGGAARPAAAAAPLPQSIRAEAAANGTGPLIEPGPEAAFPEPPAARIPPSTREAATDSGSPAPALPAKPREERRMAAPVESPVPQPTPPPTVKPAPEQKQKPAGGALQARLTKTMKQLRDDAGLERAMFAILAPDRKSLRARFVFGAAADAPIKSFRVSLGQRNLFSALMAKPQSFWLHSGNREKYLSAVPPPLHGAVNIQGFFVSSLFVDGKPVGVLYADCGDAARLNDRSFSRFKQLAGQLSTQLDPNAKIRAAG